MATTFESRNAGTVTPHRDARMAYRMALTMAAVIVAGFSLNLAMGRSSFAVPLAYHFHAAIFFGWTALFVVQTRLAALGQITNHRRLGRATAMLLPLLLVMGMVIMVTSLRRTGGPFFFAQNEFFWGNLLLLLCFAGLVIAAVRRRRETDWHSRYMLTGMAILTGPGFGRILPMPLLIPWAWHISLLVSLIFPFVGMILDKRRDGAVHPAWIMATGAVLAVHAIAMVIAYTAPGIAATEAVVTGTPGAARPMAAFLP
jgi:uncharacterized membrane protein YozB (DUF420 family)